MPRVAVIFWLLLVWPYALGRAESWPNSGPANTAQCGGEPTTCGPNQETCAPAPAVPPSAPNIVVKVPRQIELQQPAVAESAAPVGAYMLPPQTGILQGPATAYGIEGMVITLPQLQLKFPSIQFPSLFVARRSAQMVTNSAEAPFVATGSSTAQATGGGSTIATVPNLVAMNAAATQAAGPGPAYVVNAPQGYALVTPYGAGVPMQSPPARLVIPAATAQAPAITDQLQVAPNGAENLDAKLRQLQEREQHLQMQLEELQRYLEQREDPQRSAAPQPAPRPPLPMPQPDCRSQSEISAGPVIQQSVYRESVESPQSANSALLIQRLPRVD